MTTEQSAYDIARRFQNHQDWLHSPEDSEPDLVSLEGDPQLEQYLGYTEFEHSDTDAVLMLSANRGFDGDQHVASAELHQPLDQELEIQYSDQFEDGFFADLFHSYREFETSLGTEYTGTREPDSSVVMTASVPEGYNPDLVDQTVDAFSEVSGEVRTMHQSLRSVVGILSGAPEQ